MTIRRARSLRGSLRFLAALALLARRGRSCGLRQRQQRQLVELASSSSSGSGGALIKTDSANGKTTLVVGSKNFTEQKVLGEIYAQAFAAAGYKVRKELNLGDEQTALKALKSGTISGYPEYTGTALLSFLGVKAGDLPKTDAAAYDQVKAGMAKQGIAAQPPTPFTDSNEVGGDEGHGRQVRAEDHQRPRRASAKDLTLYGSPECRTAQGLPARPRAGLRAEVQEVHAGQRRPAPRGAQERPGGRVDRLHDRPADQRGTRRSCSRTTRACSRPTTRRSSSSPARPRRPGPDLQRTIDLVNKNLTAEVMQELNARVDLDKDTPAAAAAAYLKQFKLVS